MGRKKIEMKMLQDKSARHATFSKRRAGVFKKADELATLCGAHVAIVAFSPGGKPFSFGSPNVHTVTQRFLNQQRGLHSSAAAEEPVRLEALREELNDIQKLVDLETRKGELLDKALQKMNVKPINEMNFDEIQKLKASMLELKEKIKNRVVEMEASNSLLLLSKEGPQDN